MEGSAAALVRAVFAGWNAKGVEGMLPFFHRDIEYTPMEEGRAVHGHDGLRRYFERWMDSWEELHVAPTELVEAGGRVFNGASVRGRGRDSGVEVTMHYWQVWLIREGKALRWDEYLDRTDALEAAGLTETVPDP